MDSLMSWVKMGVVDDGSGGPGERWGHTCNAIKGGKFLYVFGGYGAEWTTNEVHVLDVVKQSWSKPLIKGTPPCPRFKHSCTTVGDNLFVFGGATCSGTLDDFLVLDTSSLTWITPILNGLGPTAREGHGAALVGECLYIFGGSRNSLSENEDVYCNDLYVLNTETFEIVKATTLGTSPSPRECHTCSSWKNKIIVIGGEDWLAKELSDVHILDTDTMIWMELNTYGQMLPPRSSHTTVAFGRFLFVLAGSAGNCDIFNDIHMLDVDTGLWTKVQAIGSGPSARIFAAGDCLDPLLTGALVFIGGSNKDLDALDDMYYLYTGLVRDRVSLKNQLRKRCQEQVLTHAIQLVQGNRTYEAKAIENLHGLVIPNPNRFLTDPYSIRKAAGEEDSSKSKSPRTLHPIYEDDVHGKGLMWGDPHREFADASASKGKTPVLVSEDSAPSDVSKKRASGEVGDVDSNQENIRKSKSLRLLVQRDPIDLTQDTASQDLSMIPSNSEEDRATETNNEVLPDAANDTVTAPQSKDAEMTGG